MTLHLDLSWRPGGGDSFSGGGGHGGSGGGGGGGGNIGDIIEIIYYLVRLCIEVPYVGIPLVCIIVGYILYSAYKRQKNKDWDSGPPVELKKAKELVAMRRADPDFSQVTFEDFAYRLFSTAHRTRTPKDKVAAVGPYMTDAAKKSLMDRAPVGEPVLQVVVGAMRAYRVDVPDFKHERAYIGVEFEANVATAKHTYYSVESWLFSRSGEAVSKPPGVARNFPCPNCGAPWASTGTGTQVCASCGQQVDNGRFDWVVDQVSLSSIDERPPSLEGEVEERGTDLPTYRQDGVDEKWLALDKQLTWPDLQSRLTLIYEQLNVAWAANDLRPVRGFVSDGLYDYLTYWTEAYKRQGLMNRLVDMRITHTTMAKVARDKYFDSVTIRIWGTGKDFVVRTADDSLVRGKRNKERKYSEYWTLIRSTAKKGPPKLDSSCNNCGAPLTVNAAGACEHCGQHVTSGEFDWVLSKIEQDDTYRG